jgi:carotenoid cleavage dioxygenase-like enzyme
MDGTQTQNPYLSGNFAPVADESEFELKVEGQIPADLAGAFYRNGPNPQFPPRGQHHWFFGDGMVHAVFVEDGKARYRNRYARTPKWLAEHRAGRALVSIDPREADPEAAGIDGGVANTNIVWHGGKLLALEEGHEPLELDPMTLETRGYVEAYHGRTTAHPKMDPETGEMVWFGYSVGPMPFSSGMSYGVTAADGTVTRRDDFQAPYSSMVHDFLVTRNHVLFPVLPLTGSLERAMRGAPPFAWEPEKASFVGVMRRDASVDTIRWFQTDPCYVFHPMNAWEEGSRIIADVMEYPVAPLFPLADGSSPMERPYARLTRWTFDLSDDSNSFRREPIDDMAGEFPRFDERHAGLAYRHGWFAATRRPGSTSFDSLAHIDLASGARKAWELPPGDFTGEPVFVPRKAGAAEGDGWLVALVYRGDEDQSDFVVLDAQDVTAGPIASARIPRRVPFGFHGNWKPA